MLRRLSLKNRLVLFAGACLLPLLVVTLVILSETADAGREQVLDAQASTAEVAASVISATIVDNQKVLPSSTQHRPCAANGGRCLPSTRSISSAGRIPISTVYSC